MSRSARLLVAVASLSMIVTFFVPLWRVDLWAPQYPEGIGMLIRLNTVTGIKPQDLDNINGLNHYIGMKPIVPDAIPELALMPWIVGALILTGLLVAWSGRRAALMGWMAAFASLLVAGLIDFWRWGYDYGHDLAGDAIIKVPGMTYQPPLIGTKALLNFVASSWPSVGAMALGAAFALGAAALVLTRRRALLALGIALAATPSVSAGLGAQSRPPLVVAPSGTLTSVGAAVLSARPGDRIVVRAGVYREPTIVVDKSLEIVGEPGAILDGQGARQIMTVAADDVTVRGLRFRNVGTSYVEDRAGVKVQKASGCIIEDNQFDDAFFGIYLAEVTDCRIARNVLRATARTEATSGNGIHLWSSRRISIDSNTISGHRDGIYFEFVLNSTIRGNLSERNLRYGLHFMYSDDCRYLDNTFQRNGSGVAVMYTKRVEMSGNRFQNNWGSAAYGLLLKEISDPVIVRNRFSQNSVGLFADGATRLRAEGNEFVDNGWAVQLMASTQDAHFVGNEFIANTFDVATNSRQSAGSFDRNYWDDYRGYDLDRDGTGDVPHRPVRLFSLLVAQNKPSLILLRSLFVGLLDAAERVLPALTPETLVDARPSMHRRQ